MRRKKKRREKRKKEIPGKRNSPPGKGKNRRKR